MNSWYGAPILNVMKNTKNITNKNIGIPRNRLVTTLSILSVSVSLSPDGFLTHFFIILSISAYLASINTSSILSSNSVSNCLRISVNFLKFSLSGDASAKSSASSSASSNLTATHESGAEPIFRFGNNFLTSSI